MNFDSDLSDEHQPTERFTEQRCPHCATVNVVALCELTAPCARCGELLEVAPLEPSWAWAGG